MNPQRPSLGIIWLYALGQFGWSLANYGVSSYLSTFYMPPEKAGEVALFPPYIFQGSLLFGATIIGLVSFGGRLFDAFIDPFIANKSDKSTSKLGKRRIFMLIAALPLATTSYLIFQPITEGVASINVIWLIGMMFLYYIFFAMYVIPYTALIAELGHFPEDRLRISTILSITWALGALIGSQALAFKTFISDFLDIDKTSGFQVVMLIFAVISLIFMLIPVFFLNEKKYAAQGEAQEDMWTALSSVFKNRSFRTFSLSFLLYWLAITFIQLGIAYYVVVLMGLPEEMSGLFTMISFLVSFIFYPFMGFFQKKLGKKNTLLASFAVFMLVFTLILLPFDGTIRFFMVSILAAFPLAAFGILPNTIVADIVHQHENETGQRQSGMFYAVSAFMMKVGISLANLIFPSLLVFGKGVDRPLGVQLAVGAAFMFCIIGFLVLRNYDEKAVISRN